MEWKRIGLGKLEPKHFLLKQVALGCGVKALEDIPFGAQATERPRNQPLLHIPFLMLILFPDYVVETRKVRRHDLGKQSFLVSPSAVGPN
jgi:hypothetical protein